MIAVTQPMSIDFDSAAFLAPDHDASIAAAVVELCPSVAFSAATFEDKVFARGFAIVKDDVIVPSCRTDRDNMSLWTHSAPGREVTDLGDLKWLGEVAQADLTRPEQHRYRAAHQKDPCCQTILASWCRLFLEEGTHIQHDIDLSVYFLSVISKTMGR